MPARLDVVVVDVGPPADWVKINVQRTVRTLMNCTLFKIYKILTLYVIIFFEKILPSTEGLL